MLNILVESDGRSKGQIARAAGISPSYLSELLSDSPLTPKAVVGLAHALGVTPDVLATEISKDELLEIARIQQERDRQSAAPAETPPSHPPLILRLFERFGIDEPAEVAAKSPKHPLPNSNVVIPTRKELTEVCKLYGFKPDELQQLTEWDLLVKLIGKPPRGAY